jgi:hypothetical protein
LNALGAALFVAAILGFVKGSGKDITISASRLPTAIADLSSGFRRSRLEGNKLKSNLRVISRMTLARDFRIPDNEVPIT